MGTLGKVGEPAGMFGMGRGTLREVLDKSEYPRKGPGRVKGALGEVRHVTRDPRGSPGRVGEVRNR